MLTRQCPHHLSLKQVCPLITFVRKNVTLDMCTARRLASLGAEFAMLLTASNGVSASAAPMSRASMVSSQLPVTTLAVRWLVAPPSTAQASGVAVSAAPTASTVPIRLFLLERWLVVASAAVDEAFALAPANTPPSALAASSVTAGSRVRRTTSTALSVSARESSGGGLGGAALRVPLSLVWLRVRASMPSSPFVEVLSPAPEQSLLVMRRVHAYV
jgi:hypothetical protein